MKRIKKLLDMLHSIGLDYFLVVGWYGYVLRIIANAELPLIITIIMLLGGLVFGFFSCISLFNTFGEDDQEK